MDQQGLDSTTDQDVSFLERCMPVRRNKMDCTKAKENNYLLLGVKKGHLNPSQDITPWILVEREFKY